MREANAKKSGMIQKWVLPSAGGCCWCVSIASPLSPIVSFELHCMTTTQQDTAVGRLLFPSLPPQLYVWRTYECQRSLRPSEDAEGIPQLSSTFVDRQTDCDNVTPSTRYCGLTSTSSYIYLDFLVWHSQVHLSWRTFGQNWRAQRPETWGFSSCQMERREMRSVEFTSRRFFFLSDLWMSRACTPTRCPQAKFDPRSRKGMFLGFPKVAIQPLQQRIDVKINHILGS